MRLRIKEYCQDNGIMTAYQLQRKFEDAGEKLSSAPASRLWSGKMKMVGLETLDTLVRVLKCRVEDLFDYERTKRKSKTSKELDGNSGPTGETLDTHAPGEASV